MRPRVTDKDLTEAMHRLDTVRSEILAEKYTFEEAVPYVSQDKDTRNSRGVMVNEDNGTTRFEMAQLPQEISRVVNSMSVGQISEPIIMKEPKRSRDIVAMVKLTNRIEGHKANLSDDYQMIKGMYENSLREKAVADWIEKKSRTLMSV